MSKASDNLAALVRECGAIGRQSLLLPRDLRTKPVAIHPRTDGKEVVYLLHGFMATAGIFRPLERRLSNAGIGHTGKFTYAPLQTVKELGLRLKREVERIPAHIPVHLVGHSLGGIVARYYVQSLGGHRRVSQTISMASPFYGASIASYLPSQLAKELRPGSPLLRTLRNCPEEASVVPHTSFVAAQDMLVSPMDSATFPRGDVVVVERTGHNGMLFSSQVMDTLVQLIIRAPGARSEAAE